MYLYYIVALVVIALDQLTKWVVAQTMELGEQITVIGNFFLFNVTS